MKIIKPTPVGILTRNYRQAGHEHLGIAIPLMVSLGDVPHLVSESELWNTVGSELGVYALDAALPKQHPEFLVAGRAYGQYCDAAHTCRVGIRFAGLDKQLRVSGAREWNGDTPSHAAPFECLPLDWSLAYGGPGYAENPRGIGFPTSAQRSALLLPQMTYPNAPAATRERGTAPAAFTPIAADWPQRSALYGEMDSQWREEDCPGFPRTMHPAYFNVAPTDQQFPHLASLAPGAAYELTHMHPERPILAGTLPPLRARCFLQRTRESNLTEVAMRLTTVWFIPHRERAIMIFHGTAPVQEFDAQDVACLLLAAECHSEPRNDAHYRRVFDLRMDNKRGALHALRDLDLAPQSLLAAESDAEHARNAQAEPPISALQRNLQQRAHEQVSQAAAAGVVISAPEVLATRPPRLDELAEFVERNEKFAETQLAALEQTRQRIEAEHPELAASRNAAARRGPPQSFASNRAQHPALPEVLEQEREAERRLRASYLQSAHYQEAAARLDATSSAALRERVAAGHSRGESLAGLDLTGADLSGMNLRDADLAGALLESADLSNADLTGANLRDAVIVRAALAGTTFAKANLSGANLSLTDCDGTDFSEAVLDRSLFERAVWQNCNARRASARRVQFSGCRFEAVDFEEAALSELVFMEQTLTDVTFRAATIRKLAFIQCRLERVGFTSADIDGLGLVETVAQQIRFDHVRLRKACFAKDTVLERADFSRASLTEVNLRHTQARNARFNGATISQCDFSDAGLQQADLSDAKFDGAYLVRTDLSGASLAGADLIGAQMRRAMLHDADFDEANLFRANLAEASIDASTRLDHAYLEQTVFHPLRKAAA
ncbi:MAG: hypothetical protein QOC89_1206 [Paraburkholderia sp.]|uniref:DUF2169 family type VI secretion system accessory protein n=1 Tax=Paraburkholderia sp. TaxID=1926495 RepID=UPI002AFFB233|nr:DUF2169 domain-containing protein [Paraburkholderia sp.]MEA3083509.1 hypothetical protein [Paraburkholderia sp.]